MDKTGFRISDCPELEQVLSSSDFFQKACDSIRSPFMIKEHCKSKMDMTEPISYTVRDNSEMKIGTYSYVPITQVLQKYCQVEDVWEQIVLDNHGNRDDILTDYSQGVYFKEHSFFKDHPQALRLHFYEDAFELVNPLGLKEISTNYVLFIIQLGT